MKTVLVTGGTTRLGKCIADHLRATGWRVLTTSHRPDAGADFCCDFSSLDNLPALMEAVRRKLDGCLPDALVNNAALYRPSSGQEESSDAIRTVNCEVPIQLARWLGTKPAGGVRSVVHILDAATLSAPAALKAGSYGQSKFLLGGRLSSLVRELAPRVRVNAVAPGCVLLPVGVREKAAPRLLDYPPTAADVAQAVAFLLTNEALTGVVLPVDCGQALLNGGWMVI